MPNPSPAATQAVDLRARKSVIGLLFRLAICFAVLTGFVEAACLLFFQRVNWASWGELEHVSLPIFWISPALDVILFLLIALMLALIALAAPKLPMARAAVFIFAALMFYDWLATPERLLHRSALILALGLATVFSRVFRKYEDSFLRFSSSAARWSLAAVVLVGAGISGVARLTEKIATDTLPFAQRGAPNVVVIVVDTLRADHLSSYGYPRSTSPNMDRIAQEGVLFENAISASSWTLPSHASLLTGRYSYEHGATDVKPPSGRALDARYPTIAETFAQHGYRTGAFSANYIYFSRDLGLGRGFLHFEDYFHSAFDDFSRTLYGRECTRLILSREWIRRLVIRIGFPAIDELQPDSKTSWMVRKRASEVNRETLRWIDRNSSRPFFVFMNYFDVHRPYGTPPGYPRKFTHLTTHQVYLDETASSSSQGKDELCDETIAYTDDQIGRLLGELKRRGLDRNTLVVITSDHGDMLGEHGLFGHRNALYLPLIHVPLIFWQPGRIPAGVRVQRPVSNIALAATLADQLGMPEVSQYPGPSLKPSWTEAQAQPQWPNPLSEIARFKDEGPKAPTHFGSMTSLVTPQYHFISHQTQGIQLYDWAKDPGENSNLTASPAGEAVANTLADEVHARTSHPR